MPVEHKGKNSYGEYAWGSAVNRGITLGLIYDFPNIDGSVKLVKDSQRVSRRLISQGIFGGITDDKVEIGIDFVGWVANPAYGLQCLIDCFVGRLDLLARTVSSLFENLEITDIPSLHAQLYYI
jgi:hypothetical protein